MTDFKKLNAWQGWPVILIAVAIAYAWIYHNVKVVPRIVRIQENHVVVCAGIINYRETLKTSEMDFSFTYNGHEYNFTKNNTSKLTLRAWKDGKAWVLIVLEKDHPDNWRMLEEYEDFEYYGIKDADTAGILCNSRWKREIY